MRSGSRRMWLGGVALAIVASHTGPNRPARAAEYTVEVVKSFEPPLLSVPSELVTGPDGALYGTSRGVRIGGTIFRIDSTGTLTILHAFDALAEGYPTANVTLGSDGSLYGTTANAYTWGVIFKIDRTGAFTSLHSLQNVCSYPPPRRLVLGSDGALYGICGAGSNIDASGIVFRIDSGDGLSLLHTFRWTDGDPSKDLTVGSDGALYGTQGKMVFRIDAEGTVVPIYRFTDAYLDREGPVLTLGSDGALYGSTKLYQGGGAVFRIDGAGNFSRLHTFTVQEGASSSALTLGSDGALYGTTARMVFRIDNLGNFASLHSFGSSDGGVFTDGSCGDCRPSRVLTLGVDGALYGVTGGSIFRIDGAGTFTTLQSFAYPVLPLGYPLALGPGGALYGTGVSREGPIGAYLVSVFKIDPDGNFTSLRSFAPPTEGSIPAAPLVVGADDALYGTTLGAGTVFRLDGAGDFRSYSRLLMSPSSLDGLVAGSDGILYGRLSLGCIGGEEGGSGPIDGSIFRVEPDGSITGVAGYACGNPIPGPLTVGADGAIWGTASSEYVETSHVFRIDRAGAFDSLYPGFRPSSLTLGPDGALYGTGLGFYDYSADGGLVFRIDDTLTLSVLHVFDQVYRAAEGSSPVGLLSLGNDGALYGATARGGSADLGTLFRIDATGGFSSLHSFSGTEGGPPVARLVAGADGAMYGTTSNGGSSGLGTVFRVDSVGAFTLLHSFGGMDGASPSAALILGSDGSLYGPTRRGGSNHAGTIFRVDPSGRFESIHSFTRADGASPFTSLVRGSDDALYGTTPYGGPGGGGVVYRVVAIPPVPQTIVFEPLANRTFGDAPSTISATASSGLPVSFTASGSCSVGGDQVTLTGVGPCTLTASQVGDADYEPAPEVSQSFDVLFDFAGFLRPVMNPPVVNRAKAGRTVPIRFSLGGEQGRDVLAEGSPEVRSVPCDASAPANDIEGLVTKRSGSLRYTPKRDRYTVLWKTDKSWAGSCRELALELIDGSVHRATFRFEPSRRPHDGRGERR